MQPEELPVLRREVERPGAGGHGLLPVVVLAGAMMSTLAAAALAMSVSPHRHRCPNSGRSAPAFAPVAAPGEPTFARPAPPAPPSPPLAGVPAPVLAAPPSLDPTCAPRVYRARGDVQEWTYETCASAPMPRHFVLSRD